MGNKVMSLAQQMLDQFESVRRNEDDPNSSFWRLKQGYPEWMQTVCRKAHDNGDMLPDNTRYEYITDALIKITEAPEDADDGDLDELGYEFEPDVYNSDLLKWVSSTLTRSYYVDQVLEEQSHKEFFSLLQSAQVKEKEEVYQQVLSALREEAENLDDEEDSEGEDDNEDG